MNNSVVGLLTRRVDRNLPILASFLIGWGFITTVSGQVFYTDIVSQDGLHAEIRQVNPDGTGMRTILSGIHHPRSLALDLTGGKLYWNDLGQAAIRRVNLDGSGTVESVVSIGSSGSGLALDVAHGKIYWSTGKPDHRIRRANLDGTGQEDLITSAKAPMAVAVDPQRGKLYWTDLEGNLDGTGSIHCANLDGSQSEVLLTGIDEANGLACDPAGGRILWTEASDGKIQSANLDGTNLRDLVTGLFNPTTLAIDVDIGKIYWSDSAWGGQTNKVQRANLDGTMIETVISGVGFPWGIAVRSGPRVDLIKAVKPSLSNLEIGANYVLQISSDATNWTPQGDSFTATNRVMIYPNYWDVENWSQLFFRVQKVQ